MRRLSYEILERALNQAREGRMHILDIIEQTIPDLAKITSPTYPALSP